MNSPPAVSPTLLWQNAERLLGLDRLDDAQVSYEALLDVPAWRLPARLRLSIIAGNQGRLRDAVAHALAAEVLQSGDPVMLEAFCRRLIEVGELQAARECALSPAILEADDPRVIAGVGVLMSQQSFPELATRLLKQARQRGVDSPGMRYLVGLSELYAGDLDAAQRELESCLQAAPQHAPAWRSLAQLRRATPDHNHVAQLREAFARSGPADQSAPLLQYALFKELDDLGDTEAAWPALAEGMRLRRAQVQYDADEERALFEHLHTIGPLDTPSLDPPSGAETTDGPQPIFIVGMPRSGTTLLERVLGAHSRITDAGELRDFTSQLRWMCDRMGGPYLDLDLARAAEGIDWVQLGERYLSHTRWHANGRPFYTDKLPANFVHVGYIARALPHARILHMVREPMDVCFSNLKELFGESYPHSYDQVEMADHYLRYRKLMAHWHGQFPGRILDVHYGSLVADPEAVARQVLAFCGLEWEPGVVAIESRRGAVATASSTQVREPIHQRFVGQWRRYERHLQPMRERLESGLPGGLGSTGP